MVKQYVYSSNTDSTILTTKTVAYIINLMNELVKHISPTRKGSLPEMKELRRLNRDHKHSIRCIGKRGKRINK